MCGSATARAIMKGQQSDRLWLAPKKTFNDYILSLAGHAIRSLEDFPPGTEIIVNGARHVRRQDGSIPFIMSYPGIIGPVVDLERIPVRVPALWVEEPQGEDAHVVRLGAILSAGMLGAQRLRLSLDFRRREDGDDRFDNQAFGRGNQEALES